MKKILNKYNNRFKKLILQTILDINKSSSNSALIKTGDLLRSIDSEIVMGIYSNWKGLDSNNLK